MPGIAWISWGYYKVVACSCHNTELDQPGMLIEKIYLVGLIVLNESKHFFGHFTPDGAPAGFEGFWWSQGTEMDLSQRTRVSLKVSLVWKPLLPQKFLRFGAPSLFQDRVEVNSRKAHSVDGQIVGYFGLGIRNRRGAVQIIEQEYSMPTSAHTYTSYIYIHNIIVYIYIHTRYILLYTVPDVPVLLTTDGGYLQDLQGHTTLHKLLQLWGCGHASISVAMRSNGPIFVVPM